MLLSLSFLLPVSLCQVTPGEVVVVDAIPRIVEGLSPFDLPGALEFDVSGAVLAARDDFDGDGEDEFLTVEDTGTSFGVDVVQIQKNAMVSSMGVSWTLFDNPTIDFGSLDPLIADVTGDGLADILVDRQNANVGLGSPAGFLVRDGLGSGAPVLWGASLGGNVVRWELGDLVTTPGRNFVVVHAGDDSSPALPVMRWWAFTGGGFAGGPSTSLGSLDDARSLATASLVGTSSDDVAVLFGQPATRVDLYETVGSGLALADSFSLPSEFNGTDAVLLAGDVDADGDDDLSVVAVAGSDLELWILENVGTGNLIPATVSSLSLSSSIGPSVADARWLDLDGSGQPELVFGSNPLAIVELDGFSAQRATVRPGVQGGRALLIEDVDRDGTDDLIGEDWFLLNTGRLDGGLVSPSTPEVTLITPRVTDFDGDGDLDVADQLANVWLNDATGSFVSSGTGFPIPNGLNLFGRTAAIDDLDADGRIDYVAQFLLLQPFPLPPLVLGMGRITDGGTGEFEIGGAATMTGVEIPDDSGNPWTTADIDGDGSPDILTSEGWWQNDGTGYFGSAPIPTWSGRPLAMGDVDADGDDDVVVDVNGVPTLFRSNAGTVEEIPLPSIASDASVFALDWARGPAKELVILEPSTERARLFLWQDGLVELQSLDVPGLTSDRPVQFQRFDLTRAELYLTRFDESGRRRLVRFGPSPSSDEFLRGREQFLGAPIELVFDVDGDGDDDLMSGGRAITNRRFDGEQRGRWRQYGVGTPDSLGAAPLLGLRGPFRVGTDMFPEILVSRAPGLSLGYLALALGETSIPIPNFGGLTLYVDPIVAFIPFATGGSSMSPGSGAVRLPFLVDPALAGDSRNLQGFILDPNQPGTVAATNGLETVLGFQ